MASDFRKKLGQLVKEEMHAAGDGAAECAAEMVDALTDTLAVTIAFAGKGDPKIIEETLFKVDGKLAAVAVGNAWASRAAFRGGPKDE
jgi:hypothetical protein